MPTLRAMLFIRDMECYAPDWKTKPSVLSPSRVMSNNIWQELLFNKSCIRKILYLKELRSIFRRHNRKIFGSWLSKESIWDIYEMVFENFRRWLCKSLKKNLYKIYLIYLFQRKITFILVNLVLWVSIEQPQGPQATVILFHWVWAAEGKR